jgi:endonuclease G
MSEVKADRVKDFLRWIRPEDGLESAFAEGSSHLDGIEAPPWATEAEVEQALEGAARLGRDEPLSPEQADALEAIILPRERPVVDIVHGTFAVPQPPFTHLADAPARAVIEHAIPAIGRVDLPGHPTLPYAGTAFVVGDGTLMTNRHVAELFALGIGRDELAFRPGHDAGVDFLHERDQPESLFFRIARVAMIHPHWDVAVLEVDGLDTVQPLLLSLAEPGDLLGHEVAVIGYPAPDPRSNLELQNRIFGGVFGVKRLQPGKLHGLRDTKSFGNDVSALTHDSSTLGGNSGSALVDMKDGTVVGIHFAGRYLETNFAVPTSQLALDARIVEAGVNFESEPRITGPAPWDARWIEVDPPRAALASRPALEGREPSVQTWTIPIEVTVEVGPGGPVQLTAGRVQAEPEALVEPFRDDELSTRRGYDDRFLGIQVPLPAVRDEDVVSRLDDGSFVLHYEHFSLVVHRRRRLALYTASNVDAEAVRKRPEPAHDYTRRGLSGLGTNDQEKWFTDPRIPAIHQLPDRFFTKDGGAFDKGHIVRRDDVAWGDTYDEVRRANGDTFHVTNCSPQIAGFNRSNRQGAWGRLENLILRQAATERYCQFAGPVLRDGDPLFRGVDDAGQVRVAIPRQFWKIVVARREDALETFAFVLEQDLADTEVEFAVDAEWRGRMVSLPDLETLVSLLTFPAELHDSDQFGEPPGEAVRSGAGLEL